jgi:predicted metal-dependent enzyme (double-stranded beta helix superfamily)
MSYFIEEPEEILPGVTIERRSFLKLSALALAPFLISCKEAELGLSLEEMIKTISPAGQKLIKAKNPDEEAYLKKVSEMAQNLVGLKHAATTNRKVKFDRLHKEAHFMVVQIRMKPGAALPYHDHRDYNGVICALEGSARIRNFDSVNDMNKSRKAQKFKIKETQNRVIKKGEVSSLSRSRDNIHDIRAGKEGVLFLDIFTFFNKQAQSKYLKVADKAHDSDKKIFTASWQ